VTPTYPDYSSADSRYGGDSSTEGQAISVTRSLRRNAGSLTIATMIVGAVNFGYGLILTWLLPVGQYSIFAALQTLLLMAANVANASLPWVLSDAVSSNPVSSVARRDALSFVIIASLAEGLLVTLLLALIAHRVASPLVLAVVAVDCLVVFSAVPILGYFQGSDWFNAIAKLRVAEVVVKVASGLGLAKVGAGVAGALFGFTAGGLVLLGFGAPIIVREIRLNLRPLRSSVLWRQTANLAAIQAGVAVLAGVDLIFATLLWKGSQGDLASYQVAILCSRVPLFLAGSLAPTVFQKLTSGRGEPSLIILTAVEVMLFVFVPTFFLIVTVPPALVRTFFPAAYSSINTLLPYTALSGVLIGAINLFTTFFQSRRRYGPALAALAAGVVDLATITLGLRLDGLLGMAIGSVVGLSIVLAILLVAAVLMLNLRFTLRKQLVVVSLFSLPLIGLRESPLLWLPYAVALFAGTSWFAFWRERPTEDTIVGREEPVPLHTK
jgi:O-antigen/teichoic acid export membrane protein